MKTFKKILLWSLIPVVLELAGLFYINNFYLNDETTFNAKKVNLSIKKQNKISVKVPDDAKNISVSYSGNYVSYDEDGVIYVIDTSNNKKKEIKLENDYKLSMYKWLPDRDFILISEKYTELGGSTSLKFESYNAKKDDKTFLSDENNKQLKIPLTSSQYDVLQISFSSSTNVTYVRVGKNGSRDKIYRFNIMAQLEQTKYVNCKLGNIAAINKEDKLIYEDDTNNRIRTVGLTNPIATGENATHYLLGTDAEDYIYIGNGEEGKVSKIFKASLKLPRSGWKTANLTNAVNKENIYITRDGKIYINFPSRNVIECTETGKETQYSGTIIQVCSFGIISKYNGKIISTLF